MAFLNAVTKMEEQLVNERLNKHREVEEDSHSSSRSSKSEETEQTESRCIVINTADFSLKPGSLSSSERTEAVKQLEKLGKLHVLNHLQMRQFLGRQRDTVL